MQQNKGAKKSAPAKKTAAKKAAPVKKAAAAKVTESAGEKVCSFTPDTSNE